MSAVVVKQGKIPYALLDQFQPATVHLEQFN